MLNKGLLERKNTGIALRSGITCFQHLPPVLVPTLLTPPRSLGAQIRLLLGPTLTGVEKSHLFQARAEGRQRISRCEQPWQGTLRTEDGGDPVASSPMALCHLSAPWPQQEQQKDCQAGLASERVPKFPPLELWVRIGSLMIFLKSCTTLFG